MVSAETEFNFLVRYWIKKCAVVRIAGGLSLFFDHDFEFKLHKVKMRDETNLCLDTGWKIGFLDLSLYLFRR